MTEETALLFTLQQENHDKEMKSMKEVLETMKGEIVKLAKQSQKKGGNNNDENTNPNTAGTITPRLVNKSTRPKPSVTFGVLPMLMATRALSPNCKQWGRHMATDCLELEANKEKRPATQTSNIKH